MTKPIAESMLRERLVARGLQEPLAGPALRATLAVLGERLVDDEAAALASALPPELAAVVEDAEYEADFSSAELYERVRRRERTTLGRAREHVDIVMMTLGECMDPARCLRLARALPEHIAELLRDPDDPGFRRPRLIARGHALRERRR